MSLKKCCICGGDLVENRCVSCGMRMSDDTSRYHLNEDRSYHEEHCKPAPQGKSSVQGQFQTRSAQAPGSTAGGQAKGGKRRPVIPYGFGESEDTRKKGVSIIVVFVIVIVILLISAAKSYEDSKTDDLSKWFDDSASATSMWEG